VGRAELTPAVPAGDLVVVAAPEAPGPGSSNTLVRLLPVVMSVITMGVMAATFLSGSALSRNPMFLAFPMMMLVSMVLTAVTGRRTRRGSLVAADRAGYLGYLGRLRQTVAQTAMAQRLSLVNDHPEPEALWTLIGGPRMWNRRPGDPEFCVVRVGLGTRPLAPRLVAPETSSDERSDPVTATSLQRFLDAHSTIADAPVTIALRGIATVRIDGDHARVRGLLRAMICQLAVRHAPDQLLIVGSISDHNRVHWDWLKWLPHNGTPSAGGSAPTHTVMVVDPDERAEPAAAEAVTILQVGTGGEGAPLTIRHPDVADASVRPDHMELVDALVCARRLAGQRVLEADAVLAGWTGLMGIDDVKSFDPTTLWRNQSHGHRLRAPVGTMVDGAPLELDIKEPAEHGMGPHGLCVGATGSGKSELLRTIALGMMARNSPEVLNLLLIDFKGGATFLDLARSPHVAAVITNLAEEAPLVARMRDALAGEMNRRQQLLRVAGCAGLAAYERARLAGRVLTALPTLFIIVDEFSELLSQHPDFADMFVAIGRLGRSLGMHLLLASQRLDEGRLRGLEAHLSYRICLKVLSPSESRTALGTLDAYHLPNTPGVGFLRSSTGEPIRFQAAFVSAPLQQNAAASEHAPPTARLFTSRKMGQARPNLESERSILQAFLDRVSNYAPRAHQVWLPPLEESPPLRSLLLHAGSCLSVPIAIVDRPFEQCRTPLMVDLSGAAGNVAVIGAPQAGKSAALRTLITALAATHDAAQVQFYCLDFGGGSLATLRALPHVGAVAGRADPQLVARMIAQLESVVRSREAMFRELHVDSIARYRQLRAERGAVSDADPFGDVFLVVDGWAGLRHEFGWLEDSITAIAVQGLSFGVHVVLSASRWAEIRPSLKDQLGTRIELRLGDPADSELDRKQARQVPAGRPGRGLSREGLHFQIALPSEGDELPHRSDESDAPQIPLLPERVDYDTVVRRAGNAIGTGILLGIEERRLEPVAIDFERETHLMILGDNECGKTATLRTLCREIVRTRSAGQAQLLIVDFRRTLLGVFESEHVHGYAMSTRALEALLPSVLDRLRQRMPAPELSQAQLRARSWWSGPGIYIVVDDYDLIATPAGNPLSPLLEYLPYARDLGLHLVVARRSGGAARALFEPLLSGLRDLGCAGLMMSGRSDEGALLGSLRPGPLPPGRGVLVTRRGEEQRLQVAWSPS
jgi:DNA segregation ATPase FtsK/SpoIIIE, S-DNA-T family